MSTRQVVDASVVVKWYVPETDSAAAVALLEAASDLLAPDLLAAELANTLWKKVRRGELTAAQAEEVVAAFSNACPVTLVSSLRLLPAALELALRWQRSVYDCLYLALAVAEGCHLFTADARFAAGLAGSPLAATVRTVGAGQ